MIVIVVVVCVYIYFNFFFPDKRIYQPEKQQNNCEIVNTKKKSQN